MKHIKELETHIDFKDDVIAEQAEAHGITRTDYITYYNTKNIVNEAEVFNTKHVLTLEGFQAYQDYTNTKDLDQLKDKIKKDATTELKRLLPTVDDKWIDNFEDESTDRGIKFKFKIKGGDTIHMYKIDKYEGRYDYYLNKRKTTKSKIIKYLADKHLTTLDQFIKAIASFDQHADRIDDASRYANASANNKSIIDLFDQLSKSEQKKALKQVKKQKNNSLANMLQKKAK